MTEWKIIKVKTLPKKYRQKVKTLQYTCFSANESKRERVIQRDRFFLDPYSYLLAVRSDALYGVAMIFTKNIKYDEKSITLGGIGGVCTKKSKRKLGIATSLLGKAMRELKQKHCDAAYICTNVKDRKLVKLYGKLGFVVLKKKYTYLGKSGKRYYDRCGMVAPLNSESKFNLILKRKGMLDLGLGNW